MREWGREWRRGQGTVWFWAQVMSDAPVRAARSLMWLACTRQRMHAPPELPQVLCFDHNLVMLWEYDARVHFPHHSHIKEVRGRPVVGSPCPP